LIPDIAYNKFWAACEGAPKLGGIPNLLIHLWSCLQVARNTKRSSLAHTQRCVPRFSAHRPDRVPNEERGRVMRQRLLEAAINCLVEAGFGGTSTTLGSPGPGPASTIPGHGGVLRLGLG
jgi:hypothetical protein